MKRFLIILMLALLLAGFSVPEAQAQGGTTPTPTYTPIPTRTPVASTQVVQTVILASVPMQINRSATYGDVYVVVAIAALGVMFAMNWAYHWVKDHIKVSE